MLKITGKYNTATVMCDNVEYSTLDQLKEMMDLDTFEKSNIVIMPDCHAGKGSVVGFTSTLTDKIIPNVVGVDIGCGMLTANLGKLGEIDFKAFDNQVKRSIPAGFNIRRDIHPLAKKFESAINFVFDKYPITDKRDRFLYALGTLGGGNHFIELDKDTEDNIYLVVHCGSRNFGLQIANYFQTLAKSTTGRNYNIAHLEGENMTDYFACMKIALNYALLNRKIIISELIRHFKVEPIEVFDTMHNYIDFEDNIIRKGSILAKTKEKVLIPLNMRDGSIIGYGKGNADWNYSAPHGAGRLYSRTKAKSELSIENFKKDMEGIYSTCVVEATLDESPSAYKESSFIINAIKDTIDVDKIIKPIYNFKSIEENNRWKK